MRVLLTGATGFVGSHLLRGLLKDGHEVCVVKRSYSDTWRIQELLKECRIYDLDKVSIGQIYQECPVDCVIHCATRYVRDNREYQKNIESNLLFPLGLLGEAGIQGVRYFINTATFFEKQLTVGTGRNLYSYSYVLSKAQFAQWGRMFASEYGMVFVNMQLEHVYGELDNSGKFIPYILGQLKKNVPYLALSEGIQQRDFIHVSDVVDAYRIVLSNLDRGDGDGYKAYEVGIGQARSLREFVELVHGATNSTTKLGWGEVPMAEGELMYSRADNSGLRKLGWKPKVISDHDIEQKFGGGIVHVIYILRYAIQKGGVRECVL